MRANHAFEGGCWIPSLGVFQGCPVVQLHKAIHTWEWQSARCISCSHLGVSVHTSVTPFAIGLPVPFTSHHKIAIHCHLHAVWLVPKASTFLSFLPLVTCFLCSLRTVSYTHLTLPTTVIV